MEVQLHVDVRMRQKAGTQTTKIKSAKSFVEVHPRKFIPSKYTRYTVYHEIEKMITLNTLFHFENHHEKVSKQNQNRRKKDNNFLGLGKNSTSKEYVILLQSYHFFH